jgi:hypothetical protein
VLIPRRLATAIIAVVCVVWAANFAAQFIVPGYKLDSAIDGIFIATVGGALTLSYKQSGKHSKDNDDGDRKDRTPELDRAQARRERERLRDLAQAPQQPTRTRGDARWWRTRK